MKRLTIFFIAMLLLSFPALSEAAQWNIKKFKSEMEEKLAKQYFVKKLKYKMISRSDEVIDELWTNLNWVLDFTVHSYGTSEGAKLYYIDEGGLLSKPKMYQIFASQGGIGLIVTTILGKQEIKMLVMGFSIEEGLAFMGKQGVMSKEDKSKEKPLEESFDLIKEMAKETSVFKKNQDKRVTREIAQAKFKSLFEGKQIVRSEASEDTLG